MNADHNAAIERLIGTANKMHMERSMGNAYGVYKIHNIIHLWDLGQEINNLIKSRDLQTILTEVKRILSRKKLRYDDQLYKCAITVNKFWSKEEFLNVTKSIDSWGKMRTIVPLLKRASENDRNIAKTDLNKVVQNCKGKTYEEFYSIIQLFRLKFDVKLAKLGVDVYDLNESLLFSNKQLVRKIENRDVKFEKNFRKVFNDAFLKDVRICLAGLQEEDVYARYENKIIVFTKSKNPLADDKLVAKILKIIETLKAVMPNSSTRDKLRTGRITHQLGKLSTYLKALSNNESYKQYQGSKKIVNELIGKVYADS